MRWVRRASGAIVYGGSQMRGCDSCEATGRSRSCEEKRGALVRFRQVWSCMCVVPVTCPDRDVLDGLDVLSAFYQYTCSSDSDTTPLRKFRNEPTRLSGSKRSKRSLPIKYFAMAVDPLIHSSDPTQVRVQLVDKSRNYPHSPKNGDPYPTSSLADSQQQQKESTRST
jgi:hypothetical protein